MCECVRADGADWMHGVHGSGHGAYLVDGVVRSGIGIRGVTEDVVNVLGVLWRRQLASPVHAMFAVDVWNLRHV